MSSEIFKLVSVFLTDKEFNVIASRCDLPYEYRKYRLLENESLYDHEIDEIKKSSSIYTIPPSINLRLFNKLIFINDLNSNCLITPDIRYRLANYTVGITNGERSSIGFQNRLLYEWYLSTLFRKVDLVCTPTCHIFAEMFGCSARGVQIGDHHTIHRVNELILHVVSTSGTYPGTISARIHSDGYLYIAHHAVRELLLPLQNKIVFECEIK